MALYYILVFGLTILISHLSFEYFEKIIIKKNRTKIAKDDATLKSKKAETI